MILLLLFLFSALGRAVRRLLVNAVRTNVNVNQAAPVHGPGRIHCAEAGQTFRDPVGRKHCIGNGENWFQDGVVQANLLGSTVTFGGASFAMGPANAPSAVSSATVTLPAGQYSTLAMLGTGVNGNQASQTFTVTYSDGTTS